jgi:hypothetical protein
VFRRGPSDRRWTSRRWPTAAPATAGPATQPRTHHPRNRRKARASALIRGDRGRGSSRRGARWVVVGRDRRDAGDDDTRRLGAPTPLPPRPGFLRPSEAAPSILHWSTEWAPWDSNPQPMDQKSAVSRVLRRSYLLTLTYAAPMLPQLPAAASGSQSDSQSSNRSWVANGGSCAMSDRSGL